MSADHDNGNTPRDGRGEVEVILPEWTTDGHLEEGTVHTWLDGAFDDAQAAVVEMAARSSGWRFLGEAVIGHIGRGGGWNHVVRTLRRPPLTSKGT